MLCNSGDKCTKKQNDIPSLSKENSGIFEMLEGTCAKVYNLQLPSIKEFVRSNRFKLGLCQTFCSHSRMSVQLTYDKLTLGKEYL